MRRDRTLPAIRVTAHEREQIAANARAAGKGVSEFVRDLALGAGGSDSIRAEAAAARDALAELAGEPVAGPERIGLDTHVDAHAPVAVALPNAIQLSGRTGLPKATCQKMLDRGEVRWIKRPESSDVLLELKLNGQWQVP